MADTKISLVDGERGRLVYRGYSIKDLAEHSTYEEVVFLLLMGRLPSESELDATTRALLGARTLPPAVNACLKSRSPGARPMDVVQGAIAVLADHDPDVESLTREGFVRASLRLIARTSSVVTAWHHIRNGHPAPAASTDASFAAAFLSDLWGRGPTADEARLMDILLIVHAEHSFNASTFTARQVASTQANLYASVSAAVGALSGPLHGGANAQVMLMLQQIGDAGNAARWVRERLHKKERVMGFGHAVYKTHDPRAAILREIAERVLKGKPDEKWFNLALAVEKATTAELRERKHLDIYPNVDFYSSPVLSSIGLPVAMFPAFFAVSRTAGWAAHVIEERFAEAQPKPALYRPDADYVGRYCGDNGCEWTPLESRGIGCPPEQIFKGCQEFPTF